MANHKSAIKRARQIVKRTQRNVAGRTNVKTAVRKFREALGQGDLDVATNLHRVACRAMRRAASKGMLNTKSVSRRIGRMGRALASASS